MVAGSQQTAPRCSKRAARLQQLSLVILQVLKERTVSLFFSESPTNPYLRCVDVPRISQLCRQHGALVVIDSTFATPVNQRVRPAAPVLLLPTVQMRRHHVRAPSSGPHTVNHLRQATSSRC